MYILPVAWKIVTLCFSIFISTSSGSNFFKSTTDPPCIKLARKCPLKFEETYIGIAVSNTSPGRIPVTLAIHLPEARVFRCLYTMPFGQPVVPEV